MLICIITVPTTYYCIHAVRSCGVSCPLRQQFARKRKIQLHDFSCSTTIYRSDVGKYIILYYYSYATVVNELTESLCIPT